VFESLVRREGFRQARSESVVRLAPEPIPLHAALRRQSEAGLRGQEMVLASVRLVAPRHVKFRCGEHLVVRLLPKGKETDAQWAAPSWAVGR
jgi:hypothetical protein